MTISTFLERINPYSNVSDLASFTFPIMFPYSAQEVITVTEGLLADELCLPNDHPFLYNFCLNLKLTIPSLTVHWRQPHWLGDNSRLWLLGISCGWGEQRKMWYTEWVLKSLKAEVKRGRFCIWNGFQKVYKAMWRKEDATFKSFFCLCRFVNESEFFTCFV